MRIGREEIEAIELARKQAIFRQRISYLRKTCPDETRGYEDAAIAGHIRASDQTGRELGLVSEAAHCRWAYLMVATRGEIAHSPDVVNFIRHGGTTPDEQMSLVMKSTIAFLKKQRASMGAEA